MAGRARRGRREGGVLGPGGGVWHGGAGQVGSKGGPSATGRCLTMGKWGRGRSQDDPSQQEIQAFKDDLDKNEKAIARKGKRIKENSKSWGTGSDGHTE